MFPRARGGQAHLRASPVLPRFPLPTPGRTTRDVSPLWSYRLVVRRFRIQRARLDAGRSSRVPPLRPAAPHTPAPLLPVGPLSGAPQEPRLVGGGIGPAPPFPARRHLAPREPPHAPRGGKVSFSPLYRFAHPGQISPLPIGDDTAPAKRGGRREEDFDAAKGRETTQPVVAAL